MFKLCELYKKLKLFEFLFQFWKLIENDKQSAHPWITLSNIMHYLCMDNILE